MFEIDISNINKNKILKFIKYLSSQIKSETLSQII